MLGQWTADGSGAQGGFSFTREAGGQVLVRRNFAHYPAQNGRPSQHHEDLMVIWREGPTTHGAYWDNEGHVIHYGVTTAASGDMVLLSDDPSGPLFRLSYHRTAHGLNDKFEIAPDRAHFSDYLNCTAHRK